MPVLVDLGGGWATSQETTAALASRSMATRQLLTLSTAGAILRRSHTGDLQEIAVECGVVPIAHRRCDLGNSLFRVGAQQHLCLGDALMGDVLAERHSRKLRKHRIEHRPRHTELPGKFFWEQRFSIVLVNKPDAVGQSTAIVRGING